MEIHPAVNHFSEELFWPVNHYSKMVKYVVQMQVTEAVESCCNLRILFSGSEPATELGPLPAKPLPTPCTMADPREYKDERERRLLASWSTSTGLAGRSAASGSMNWPAAGAIFRADSSLAVKSAP